MLRRIGLDHKTPKNKKRTKSEQDIINSILIWAQKDIWVEEILLLGYEGGGSKLKVQGMDSYPLISVNICM